MVIYTIGHSTRSLVQLIEILRAHSIGTVADVRRFPASRRFPHFNREELRRGLKDCEISYLWMGKLLGGYRKGGYLAYAETGDFRKGINELIEASRKGRVAVMCAEALWFKCHRCYIADHLVRHGVDVLHISDRSHAYPHKLRDEGSDRGKEGR